MPQTDEEKVTSMVAIEKNVPMPKSGLRVKPKPPWLLEMEVGDSVRLPGKKRPSVAVKGRKFATRTVAGGFRVWRIL